MTSWSGLHDARSLLEKSIAISTTCIVKSTFSWTGRRVSPLNRNSRIRLPRLARHPASVARRAWQGTRFHSISGNLALNQQPSDDIIQISQRLSTLTSSVGQLLALQTRREGLMFWGAHPLEMQVDQRYRSGINSPWHRSY
ncbi:hypothetical protein V8E52_004003 [Russula decolorans]